jgi:hypothetical protein
LVCIPASHVGILEQPVWVIVLGIAFLNYSSKGPEFLSLALHIGCAFWVLICRITPLTYVIELTEVILESLAVMKVIILVHLNKYEL